MEDRWVARPGRRALRREHLTHRGLPLRRFSARRVQGRSELSEPCPLTPGLRGPALLLFPHGPTAMRPLLSGASSNPSVSFPTTPALFRAGTFTLVPCQPDLRGSEARYF